MVGPAGQGPPPPHTLAQPVLGIESLPEELLEHVALLLFGGRGFERLFRSGTAAPPLPFWAERRRKEAGCALLRRLWGGAPRVLSWAWLVEGRLACCEVLGACGRRRDLTVFGAAAPGAGQAVHECFHARGVHGCGPRGPDLALRPGQLLDLLCTASTTHQVLFRGERVARVSEGDCYTEAHTQSGGVLTVHDDFPDFARFTHAACGESAASFLEGQNPHPVVHFRAVGRPLWPTSVLGTRLRVAYLETR